MIAAAALFVGMFLGAISLAGVVWVGMWWALTR